eukprot:jgi/Ulvmu1/10431/UM062_0027.1
MPLLTCLFALALLAHSMLSDADTRAWATGAASEGGALQDSLRISQPAAEASDVDVSTGGLLNEEEAAMDISRRTLLHGCHANSRNCRKSLPACPRCRFPGRSVVGHCKSRARLFNCRRNTESEGNEGNEGGSRFLSRVDGAISSGDCPSIHAASWPGHFDLPGDVVEFSAGDYTEADVDDEDVLDAFMYEEGVTTTIAPEFAVVDTPDEFQDALRAGVNHIVLTAHLDMVDSQPEPDLEGEEALDGAIGRVLNTTLSITGKCEGPPPPSFKLSEPMPPGACAVQVKEDFLDAPLGTTCLLLDSLYVVVAPRGPRSKSSVLILHVDGLMWITGCVFQGSGPNGRAIDTNTLNGGTPALYIKDSTFTGFTRDLAPGIRALSESRVWVDNCVFKELRLVESRRDVGIRGTAIAAYSDVFLILLNITIRENFVFGERALNQSVGVSPNGTQVFASPRGVVWQWPDGPFAQTSEQTELAELVVVTIARPELAAIQEIQQEIVRRGLIRAGLEAGSR